MPTFDELRVGADNRQLIRKAQKAVAFLAPMSKELPEKLLEAAGTFADLKTAGYLPVGMVTPDGYNYTRDIEKEDIDALGYASPVRSDVTRVPRSVTFTTLEKGRKHMLELIYGADLSGVTQDPATGEIVFDEPDMPINKEYRLLIISVDGPSDALWVMGKGFHSVKLSGGGSEQWQKEGPASTEITLDVSSDDETGTPVRHYLGGTGALKYKDVLGFVAA